ncbi:carbohydrate-binding protein [Pararhodospirillum photometricum]|uniref:Chitin-binding type-3 domain-containing protein n=1 Tax=Pararhodospirillum photometricum DSM 122 TaxID=1150469 RepID=H6SRW7_PARPM|nr:carbohydrate-binding protein [Pararhodospirillum photometricum]CCG07646.1 Putative uncharacterized protein [Pararhodospirillum photometricum DSM 122]
MVSLTYRTSDPDWGAGKGAPLTAAEVDRNFHALRLALEQTTGTPGRGIAQIAQDGWDLVLTYSDGSGTRLTLPAPSVQARGAWRAGEAYAPGDFVTREGGAYLCLARHVATPGWWSDQRAGIWATLAGTQSDSPTVHPIATGQLLAWEVPAGLALSVGQWVRVVSKADSTRWMEGEVSAYALSETLWSVTLTPTRASGTGDLADARVVPAVAVSLEGSTTAGAWSRVLSVTSPHTVSADEIGALVVVPAGGTVILSGDGFTAGDALWLETALQGSATLQVASGTLEGGTTALALVSERVWLVHEGDGAWRVAARTTVPGTLEAARPVWRSTISVAAGTSRTVAASDSGARFVLGASAVLSVPTPASLGDGAALWVEGATGASVSAALAGGASALSVAGRRVLLVADVLGAAWVVALNRPVSGEDSSASGTLAAQNADAVVITGGSLSGVVVSGGRAHGVALTHQALGARASAVVFNVAQAASFSLTPTANITVSFSGWSASGLHMVQVELIGGGDRVLTWTGVTWEGGTPPALSTGSGVDTLLFWSRDGGATVYGKMGAAFGDPAHVLGIALVATGGGSGTWARVDKAGNTLSGSDYALGGAAFNTHPVWGNLVPVTIDGQVMIRVPKFYYRVAPAPTGSAQAGKTCWWISDQPLDGFVLHPAFYKDGAPVNQFWVGKYQGSDSGGTKVASVAGVMPLTNISFTDYQARCAARNAGGVTGFMLWSVYQCAALQMLAFIEMGTTDAQGVVGLGRVNEGSPATVNATDVATATYRGIVGLWGNVWQYCDGIRVQASSGVLSVWDRQGNKSWVNTGAVRVDLGYPTSFLSSAGPTHDFRDVFVPGSVTSTYLDAIVPDLTIATTNTAYDRTASLGGAYSMGPNAGIFSIALSETASSYYENTGGRLAKV